MKNGCDIVLLTNSKYENPVEPDWYAQQILDDDKLLQIALEQRGLSVSRVSWSRPDFDWSAAKLVVVRSPWDYFERWPEFSAWLDSVAKQTRLLNPAPLLRWNLDKHYLLDLKKRGINIPPTRVIEVGETITLAQLQQETGWAESVLKPTVSGAARHTYRLNADNLSAHEAIFQQLIGVEAMILQEFQHDVVKSGELSLMILGGKYTHAVCKRAKAGDFRVQDDWGGTVHEHIATAAEIAFAEAAVAACDPQPIYARADMIRDNNGLLTIVELELVEPELWLRLHPPAALVLAEAIAGFVVSL